MRQHLGQSQRQLTDGISQELCVCRDRCVASPLEQTSGDLEKHGRALVMGRAVVPKGINLFQMHQELILLLTVEGDSLVWNIT